MIGELGELKVHAAVPLETCGRSVMPICEFGGGEVGSRSSKL